MTEPISDEGIARLREVLADPCLGTDKMASLLYLAEVEGLLARLDRAEAAGAWRPIESAPKDGTKLLLAKIVGHPAHATALWWMAKGHWSERWSNWNDGVEPAGLAGPTHWLPVDAYGVALPAPPALARPEREAE